MCLDWSSDNKRLASGSWDKTVRIWDMEQGICVSEFTAHRFADTSVFAAVTSIGPLGRRSGVARVRYNVTDMLRRQGRREMPGLEF